MKHCSYNYFFFSHIFQIILFRSMVRLFFFSKSFEFCVKSIVMYVYKNGFFFYYKKMFLYIKYPMKPFCEIMTNTIESAMLQFNT